MSLQYIIDGYNIINHPLFARTHKASPNIHQSLIKFIKTKRLTGSAKNKVMIVFDGYPPGAGRSYEDREMSMIFSRKISADEFIKKLVEESAQRKSIVVVSNDNEIKSMIKYLGARHQAIEDFVGEKEKSASHKAKEPIKAELSFSQMHKINEELKKIWLK